MGYSLHFPFCPRSGISGKSDVPPIGLASGTPLFHFFYAEQPQKSRSDFIYPPMARFGKNSAICGNTTRITVARIRISKNGSEWPMTSR